MMRRLFSKRTYVIFGILCCIFIWLQFGMESYAFTRTTGEVTGSSVKVRKEASTESEVVAGVRAGDDLDVTDAVNGADGKVWYKILISANEYGYIRSDFVTLASGEQAPSTSTTTDTTTPTTDTTEITTIDPQKGHTSTNNVKVRKAATTGSDEVDRLGQDQIFNITGTAQGPDGKMWYYVSYIDGGASKKGFIRSDLVTIMEEEVEDEPEETPDDVIEVEEEDTSKPNIPAPTTTYEAVYTTDENGDYIWYLYDRTAGQRYKVEQLLQVSKQQQEEMDELSSANFGLKIGLIITICLLVMIAVAIAFYILKMREEEEENKANRRTSQTSGGATRSQNVTRNQNVVRSQSGAGKPSVSRTQSATRSQTADRAQSGVRPQTLTKQQATTKATMAQQAARTQSSPVAKKPVNAPGTSAQSQQQKISWKAKNFLDDNDELEFGFLDFDEDDE